MRVKVLVIPVYRRHWLYHTWVEGTSESISTEPWWKTGHSVQDKFNALQAHVNQQMNTFVEEQWAANAAAKEGTFRHWLHKMTLTVMSRENPVETFLKKLPRSSTGPKGEMVLLEVLHPASVDPVLVRRRLRHMAQRNTRTHQRALLGWALACVPQAPLVITPFPNVTLYYTVYRLVSNFRALGGASTLLAGAGNPASSTLQKLYEESTDGGQQDRAGRWGARQTSSSSSKRKGRLGELSSEQRLEALLHKLHITAAPGGDVILSLRQPTPTQDAPAAGLPNAWQQVQERLQQHPDPVLVFVASQQLDDVVKPLDRWVTPLDDAVIPGLAASRWDVRGLDEHLGRVRRNALAAEAERDTTRGRPSASQPDASGDTPLGAKHMWGFPRLDDGGAGFGTGRGGDGAVQVQGLSKASASPSPKPPGFAQRDLKQEQDQGFVPGVDQEQIKAESKGGVSGGREVSRAGRLRGALAAGVGAGVMMLVAVAGGSRG